MFSIIRETLSLASVAVLMTSVSVWVITLSAV